MGRRYTSRGRRRSRTTPRVRRGVDAQRRRRARRHRGRRPCRRRVRRSARRGDADQPRCPRPQRSGHGRRGRFRGGSHPHHGTPIVAPSEHDTLDTPNALETDNTVTALDLLDNPSDSAIPETLLRVDEAGDADTALDMRLDHLLPSAPRVETPPPAPAAVPEPGRIRSIPFTRRRHRSGCRRCAARIDSCSWASPSPS